MLTAGHREGPAARAALETLCSAYWYPLYAYVRRRGIASEDARDLTQGFFAQLLERNDCARADRDRGRFRAFLLASLRNYLANEWDRERAAKRGGGVRLVALDLDGAEERYALEDGRELTPEAYFDRVWALEVLEKGLALLQAEYAARGQGASSSDALAGTLTGGEAAEAMPRSRRALPAAKARSRSPPTACASATARPCEPRSPALSPIPPRWTKSSRLCGELSRGDSRARP